MRPNAIDADRLLSAHARTTLIDYFDLYSFGLELREARVSETLGAAMQQVSRAGERSRELVRQLLSGSARHDKFVIELDLYCEDASRKLALLTRYANVSSRCGYEFWEPFNTYQPQDWEALQPYTKFLSAAADGLAEGLQRFFKEGLAAYELDLQKANDVLNTFYRYHLTSLGHTQGRVFEERIPTLMTEVRVDLGQRTIRVGAERDASTFQFTLAELPMHEEDLDMVDGIARPRGYAQRVRGKKYRRALREQTILHYEVEVPVDVQAMRSMGHEVPAVLGTVARALNLAAGTLAAKEKLAERDIEAWLDLGQNSLQLFESSVALRSALSTVHGSAPSASLTKLATIGGRAVAVVDGLRSAYAGYQVLFGDDTPILDELERGNQLRAVAVATAGMLQFTSGATGAAYGATQLVLLGGAAEATGFLAAAAGPVGIGMVVCGLLVAGIELGLVATREFGEHVEAIRAAWRKASREEFDKRSPRTLARLDRVHELAQRLA